ncbi:10751_t:CDS:2, partial [Racocetra fulgida]
GIEDNPWIPKNELKNIIGRAIAFAKKHSSHKKALSDILVEVSFKISWANKTPILNDDYAGSGAVKINEEGPNRIQKNINALKGKLTNGSALLKKNMAVLYEKLLLGVNRISISQLNWKEPLASQVISDHSDLVRQLPDRQKELFM